MLVYLTVYRLRSLAPTTKSKAVPNSENKSYIGDTYEEPERPEPPPRPDPNNQNDNGSGYENVQSPKRDDENIYQSM